MATLTKAKVFMTGRSQAVRIPAEFRIADDEVYIRRDAQTGDLILSQTKSNWDDIFAALDQAGVPDDFLVNRGDGPPQKRDDL